MKDLSYGEIVVLSDLFDKEVEARGIVFPGEEQKMGAYMDFMSQFEENPEVDPHIECLEGVTCEKEVSEIDWDEFYG